MTVSTEVDHNDYTGNGVTTSFPYTFRIFKKSDLTVQVADLNENITVLTLDTDYSVTGAGTYSGGNVVLMSPLANGWQISISRDLPVTQETDLRNQGKFFAEVHEDAFDKLTMLIQQCFSFLRLSLRKPSFIATYYDALNNRIRNLRDPSQAQDAATKNYVDGQIVDNTNAWKAGDAILDQKIDSNFARTLRVPESTVDQLSPVSVRKNSLLGWDSNGKPIPVFTMTETADLAIKLASHDAGLGASLVGLKNGETVQDAIKFVTPLTLPGSSNAAYNYSVLQAAANTNLNLSLKAGDIYISQPIQLKKGQIVIGQGAPNFSPLCYTNIICNNVDGGCFWYTNDTTTGQVRMPQISHIGLVGDYPVRFNDERTAIIKDDPALSNVPFGMNPSIRFCHISPRVNGIGTGISWSKMFDGVIDFCEIANFDIDILLNGCDLNKVAHNRIRNAWRYMVLELSASTFGSQNEIHHNDILHVGSPNCIMVKTTARHARIYDNYLEQATGTDGDALIGFIDASDVDAPSYAGNVSAGRYSTVMRDNRIDGFSKAKYFVYKYQPEGQTYGEIVDVSTVGSNIGFGSNGLTIVDGSGATVDRVPLLYNQQQPCSFFFKGPRFGKWNGYNSEGQFSEVINGMNVGAFGTSLYGNLLSNSLRSRGNEIILLSGYTGTGIFSYASSAGIFDPEKSYIIEVEAYCASGTEDFTFGGIVSGTGKVSTTFTLSTTPRKMRVEFVTGIAGSSNGIYFSRSNNGADIIIKRVRFLKKYLQENAMSASSSKTMQITTQSGEVHIAANGGFLYPAYKVLKFINGYLVEVSSQVNNAALIDITWSYTSGVLTINVTGTGGSKQLAVSQISQPG